MLSCCCVRSATLYRQLSHSICPRLRVRKGIECDKPCPVELGSEKQLCQLFSPSLLCDSPIRRSSMQRPFCFASPFSYVTAYLYVPVIALLAGTAFSLHAVLMWHARLVCALILDGRSAMRQPFSCATAILLCNGLSVRSGNCAVVTAFSFHAVLMWHVRLVCALILMVWLIGRTNLTRRIVTII
jgi:hypothetical protein